MRGSMMARLVLLGGTCLFTMGAQYSCSTGDGTLDVGDDDSTFSTTLILRDTSGTVTSGFRFGDSIRFELTIRNNTGSAQEIDLPTGQVYDFVVLNPGAQSSRWKWSTNRAFTQAAITVDFAPNESRTYPFVWNGVLEDGTQIMPGTYDARGLLAYMGHSSALRASDELASPLRTFTIIN